MPLLGLCDTAISGHLGSDIFLASIAVGSVMLNVVFWMFGFLRGGTTGLTAVAFGGKNDREIAIVLYRALFISLVAGGILIACQNPLFSFLSLISGCGEDIREYVSVYFSIRIWGAPALLATMAISGWFVGMQTTYYPMLIAILMNVINIAVSFILVFSTGMGFAGVAAGTLVSNWAGLLIAVVCMILFRKGKPLLFEIKRLFKGGLWKYFSVNGNLFVRSFFIICVTMGVTSAGSRLGTFTLAVNVIIMQFFQFFSFFMDGFAFSGEAIIGKTVGERRMEELRKSVKALLLWTLATGLIFSLGYLIFAGNVTSLLTDSQNVRSGVEELLWVIVAIPIVACWAFIFDGFYVGLTETGKMMVSTLLAAVAFFLITFLRYGDEGFGIGVGGNEWIWIGFLSYLGIRGIYLALVWRGSLNKAIGNKPFVIG